MSVLGSRHLWSSSFLVFVFFGLCPFWPSKKILKNLSVLVFVENFLKNDVNLCEICFCLCFSHRFHRKFGLGAWPQCLPCSIMRIKPFHPPNEPPLPRERVCYSRPFQNVGIDFFGPYRVRDSKRKFYGLIFSCMNTRAIHLEITSA